MRWFRCPLCNVEMNGDYCHTCKSDVSDVYIFHCKKCDKNAPHFAAITDDGDDVFCAICGTTKKQEVSFP